MCLHARRQFGGSEARLSVLSDSLLSVVFLFLHHHLETRDKDSPWDDSSTELSEHVLIDVVGKIKFSALVCQVSFMERERLLSLLGSGHRSFLVRTAALILFLQDLTI